jgi:hypothetical protein
MAKTGIELLSAGESCKRLSSKLKRNLRKSSELGCYVIFSCKNKKSIDKLILSCFSDRKINEAISSSSKTGYIEYMSFDQIRAMVNTLETQVLINQNTIDDLSAAMLALMRHSTMAKDRVIPNLLGKPLPALFFEFIKIVDTDLFNYIVSGGSNDPSYVIQAEMGIGQVQDRLSHACQVLISKKELIFTVTNSVWILSDFKRMLLEKGLSFAAYKRRLRLMSNK